MVSVADNSKEEEECQYCSYPEREYTDHVFGEYRTEHEAFEKGMLAFNLGVLGKLTVCNYIQETEVEDGTKKAYLVTYADIENEHIGDPFEISGNDWSRAEIHYCPFCGRKIV